MQFTMKTITPPFPVPIINKCKCSKTFASESLLAGRKGGGEGGGGGREENADLARTTVTGGWGCFPYNFIDDILR